MPQAGLRHPPEAVVGIVELEEASLDLGFEVQQPEIRGDAGARDAAAAGQIPLGVGLSGAQQLLVVEGPPEAIAVSGLDSARAPAEKINRKSPLRHS